MAQTTRPTTRSDFEIAIICALTLEADAVVALFDRYWDDEEERGDDPPYDKALGDANAYTAGRIGRHNVVVAHLPRDGKVRAANAASYCRMSWPAIKLALVVGICGAVPFTADGKEIILGDVIISEAVVQYDLGRQNDDEFVRKTDLLDSLPRPSEEILGFLAKLKTFRDKTRLEAKMEAHMAQLKENPGLEADYPGVKEDTLFVANHDHPDGKICEHANCKEKPIERRRLANVDPKSVIHFGRIASGDTVMKSAEKRDSIAKKEEGVIAFEMESAGVWGVFPCVVIKGVCDYADSHKLKNWQRYAAATAASCTKAFLEHWVPSAHAGSSVSDGRQDQQAGGIRSKAASRTPQRYLPLLENRNFVGRAAFMDVLRAKLFSDDNRAPHRFAIMGLGGVGKTQVANNIANWTVRNKPDWHVFWLPALSMATFEQACRYIARLLGLKEAEQTDAKELLRCYLDSDRSGPWLLIIDNADDEEVVEGNKEGGKKGIRDFLPRAGKGRILFTTRTSQIATRLAQREVLILEEMDADEARDLLVQSLRDESLLTDEKGVTELLDILTYLPLAISQAAAYLNENMATVAEYIRLLQNTERDMVELLETEFLDDTRYHGTHNAVARTWVVSFEQIRKNPDASKLLGFISHVEPKAISRSMLPPAGSEQRMTRAIGILCGYLFLSRREGELVFDMHRLVHVASRAWESTQTDAAQRRREALGHLQMIFSTDEWEERERWQPLLPHVLKAIDTEKTGSDGGQEDRNLAYWAGRCLYFEGQTREAVKLLERVVEVDEATQTEIHPNRLSSQHYLGVAYREDGREQDAINMLERVVAIREKTLPETHPDRLASQHQLAGAYRVYGRSRDAIDLLEKVVAIEATTTPETHPGRLASQGQLAVFYWADGRTQDAIHLLEKVVAVREITLPETHPDRLASQHELAGAYRADGRTRDAIHLLEKVVAIREKVLAETYPDRLASQNDLALAYDEDGRVQDAIRLLEEVVAICEISQPETHRHRLVSQKNLAVFYYNQGQIEKAVELLGYVVSIHRKVLREGHPGRVASESQLALWQASNVEEGHAAA